MAGVRESSFLPTIKCSSCLKQVEISLMGEHICSGPTAELSPPPDPQEGFSSYSQPQADKQTRTPPFVDTQAANGAFIREGQLTPNSLISEPRSTSPVSLNTRQTPTEDYFAPRSGNQNGLASSPRDIKRPSVHNHAIDYERADLEPRSISESPTTFGNSTLMQRMNSITPGPFDATRRPARVSGRNAFAPKDSTVSRMEDVPEAPAKEASSQERPGTATSTTSTVSNSNALPPKIPQRSAYEGFGPPAKTEDGGEPQPLGINRSETFPRPSAPPEPVRTLSTPGSRPDRLKKQSILEEAKRPSMGPVTSRPPPPRKSMIRPQTGKFVGSVDLAAEFGVNNPYHTPSDSSSSGYSTFSHPSRASSQTSPAKSQPRRQPSDSSNIDDLMNDLQSSIESLRSKDLRIDVPPPPRTRSPLAESPFEMSPRDERHDSAIQNGRPTPQNSEQPLLSPHFNISPRDQHSFNSSIQDVRQTEPSPRKYDQAPPSTRRYDQPLPSPQYSTSPQYITTPQYGTPPQYGTSPRDHHTNSTMQSGRRPENPVSTVPQPLRKGSRDPTAPRGDCKACKLPIKGKSISSADGRLTGKYHKACFVCSTCSEPFTSAEFYVLDDKPYCEQHYHKLNGSLCGSCGRGIEGQYLEDEFEIKYHIGCFRCLDCGRSLSEGYFEVDGKSYCERDAWRRVQQPWLAGKGTKLDSDSSLHPPPRGGPRHSKGHGIGSHTGHSAHRPSGPGMGLPRPPYGLPSGNRLSPDMAFTPRMNKRNTRLGMM